MLLETYWWSLPGPCRFVDLIEEDLQAGKNVLVGLPKYAPTGLFSVVRQRLYTSELLQFRRVDLRDDSIDPDWSPARVIHRQCGTVTETEAGYSAKSVAQWHELEETAIWVDGVDEVAWPCWKRFLEEYEHHCRERPAHLRGVFIVPVVATAEGHLSPPDVALSVRRWQGFVSHLDMLLYCAECCKETGSNPLIQELLVQIAAELSGFDPHLASWFAASDPKESLHPERMLYTFAKARGWHDEAWNATDGACSWEEGAVDAVSGQRFVHSAFAETSGRKALVMHRIWRAQLRVIFPFLEDRRLEFVSEYRPFLTLPVVTPFETIDEHDSLEFSHLCHQLRDLLAADRLQVLEYCRRLRNSLAHSRPANSNDIMSPMLDLLVQQSRNGEEC